jgi:NAD(P)H-dependent FMN reductase
LTDQTRPTLQIIIASTRPGRTGLPIGLWVRDQAIAHGGFEVQVSDLADVGLPMMDEPNHPSMQQYTKQHTKDWSAVIAAADAFVIVMPEYNHGYTAPLKNAIDYLVKEWAFKPVGLVSYGGISGGLRAVQSLKPILTGLRLTVLTESVTINHVGSLVKDGHFTPTEAIARAVTPMLDELARQVPVLRQLRK